MAGIVYCNEIVWINQAKKSPLDSVLTVKGKTLPYVSRGGLKLEKALKVFDLDIKDKILLDIGASTGGLRIVPSKMERKCHMQWMLDTINWPGS